MKKRAICFITAFFAVCLIAPVNAQERDITSGEFSPLGSKKYFDSPTYCGLEPLVESTEISRFGVQYESYQCFFHAFSAASSDVSTSVRDFISDRDGFSGRASVYRLIASCRGAYDDDWIAKSFDVALANGGGGRRMHLLEQAHDRDPDVDELQYEGETYYECTEPINAATVSPNSNSEQRVTGANYIVIRDANYRAGPDKNAARLGSFTSGTKLRVIRNIRGWVEISHDGRRVFVWDKLVTRL